MELLGRGLKTGHEELFSPAPHQCQRIVLLILSFLVCVSCPTYLQQPFCLCSEDILWPHMSSVSPHTGMVVHDGGAEAEPFPFNFHPCYLGPFGENGHGRVLILSPAHTINDRCTQFGEHLAEVLKTGKQQGDRRVPQEMLTNFPKNMGPEAGATVQ